jgi:hypothetical protein
MKDAVVNRSSLWCRGKRGALAVQSVRRTLAKCSGFCSTIARTRIRTRIRNQIKGQPSQLLWLCMHNSLTLHADQFSRQLYECSMRHMVRHGELLCNCFVVTTASNTLTLDQQVIHKGSTHLCEEDRIGRDALTVHRSEVVHGIHKQKPHLRDHVRQTVLLTARPPPPHLHDIQFKHFECFLHFLAHACQAHLSAVF